MKKQSTTVFYRSLILLSILFFSFSFLRAQEIEEIHDVEVGRVGARILRAEIALPKNRPAIPMPAVIWIHGGGWMGGSYKENPFRGLAGKGFFTASIEYRFSKEAKWPAQLDDCRQALVWLRAHANEYGFDPKRIAVAGHSAGGHLAACLGTMGGGPSGEVQAVIDMAGPADFTTGKAVYAWAIAPLLDDKDLIATERQKAASPLFAVKAGLPPFLIIHGDKDSVVPCDESLRLHQALLKAGVKSQLMVVKGGGHGFEGKSAEPGPGERETALLTFLRETLK